MSLEMAINKTINYARKFGTDLTKEEVEERLLGSKVYNFRGTKKRFKPRNENKYRGEKLKLAEILVNQYLFRITTILMVGVTGSVASGYPEEDDDIDLIIVTSAYNLWWTRLMVRWLVFKSQIPHRSWQDLNEKDKFCFNLWLDEKNLKIIKPKQNLKSAVDLVLMKPILNRKNSYEKFLQTNGWAKKYVATGYKILENKYRVDEFGREEKRLDLGSRLLNWMMFWIQYLYMKNKITEEKIGYGWAYFHPIKNAAKIRS